MRIIKENFKEGKIHCDNCNNCIAKIDKNKIHIRTYKNGKPKETVTEINHEKGGSIKLTCSNCGSYFLRKKNSLDMTYNIKKKEA